MWLSLQTFCRSLVCWTNIPGNQPAVFFAAAPCCHAVTRVITLMPCFTSFFASSPFVPTLAVPGFYFPRKPHHFGLNSRLLPRDTRQDKCLGEYLSKALQKLISIYSVSLSHLLTLSCLFSTTTESSLFMPSPHVLGSLFGKFFLSTTLAFSWVTGCQLPGYSL